MRDIMPETIGVKVDVMTALERMQAGGGRRRSSTMAPSSVLSQSATSMPAFARSLRTRFWNTKPFSPAPTTVSLDQLNALPRLTSGDLVLFSSLVSIARPGAAYRHRLDLNLPTTDPSSCRFPPPPRASPCTSAPFPATVTCVMMAYGISKAI